jgi:hypothetical protein
MKTVSMTYIKIINILFICLTISFTSNAQKDNRPWESLFNGKNLDGWKIVGSKGIIRVIDGTIVCNMTRNTPEHTFLCTEEKYKDFILEMEVKTDSTYNTGILFRCIDVPKSIDTSTVRLYGYQLKIDPSPTRRWTGGVFDDFGRTWNWLYTLANDARARQSYSIGKWNNIRIEAIGPNIKTWVNGVPATNMINKKYDTGYIAIKIHSLGNNPEMEKYYGQYRNIRIISKNPEKYSQSMDIKAIEVK